MDTRIHILQMLHILNGEDGEEPDFLSSTKREELHSILGAEKTQLVRSGSGQWQATAQDTTEFPLPISRTGVNDIYMAKLNHNKIMKLQNDSEYLIQNSVYLSIRCKGSFGFLMSRWRCEQPHPCHKQLKCT